MIPLSHLPLRPSTQKMLLSRGFNYLHEVEQSCEDSSGGVQSFAGELGTTVTVARGIWLEVQQYQKDPHVGAVSRRSRKSNHTCSTIRTADELLRFRAPEYILTGCREVDMLLGGGLATGELTEIVGPSACGKTQLAIQLAINASLSLSMGGVSGETLYIDTEGGFSADRSQQMAHALCEETRHVPNGSGILGSSQILQNIRVVRVHDISALIATVEKCLPLLVDDRLAAGASIRLVVVDSIAFPFRATPCPSMDPSKSNTHRETDAQFYATRNRQLANLAAKLGELAHVHNVAVIAINQMSSKFQQDEKCHFVPALGQVWAHAVTTSLELSRTSGRHRCVLRKSPRAAAGQADFALVAAGVRSCS